MPRRAHPRTGGEHGPRVDMSSHFGGSPPHGRGTRVRGREEHDACRLTPARAGNTSASREITAAARAHPRTGGEHRGRPTAAPPAGAHPRTGGEHAGGSDQAVGVVGSPQHGRGTRVVHGRRVGRGGLTPARAGTTAGRPICACCPPAHPRTGGEHSGQRPGARLGEHVGVPALVLVVGGSPPHGRGTLHAPRRVRQGPGLTPARAGNTAPTGSLSG